MEMMEWMLSMAADIFSYTGMHADKMHGVKNGSLAESRHWRCGCKTDLLTETSISRAFVTGATVQTSSRAKICHRNFSHFPLLISSNRMLFHWKFYFLVLLNFDVIFKGVWGCFAIWMCTSLKIFFFFSNVFLFYI